ncbi:MAG: hypothetical protein GKR99_18135 [Rhodobacteraceae bacterium]|nr:hypothetical protein [Paracoccaceae bacterium]
MTNRWEVWRKLLFLADCVEKLRNQSVADFLRKPMKRNSRKALTTRQRMAARERM